jgi:hypothetical protein
MNATHHPSPPHLSFRRHQPGVLIVPLLAVAVLSQHPVLQLETHAACPRRSETHIVRYDLYILPAVCLSVFPCPAAAGELGTELVRVFEDPFCRKWVGQSGVFIW